MLALVTTPEQEERRRLELGRRVKALRERMRMSGSLLAMKIGVSRGYIGDIENGRVNPSLDVLRRLAEALETTVAHLVGEEEGPTWREEVDGIIVHLRGPAVGDLTPEERQSIIDFVEYVRSRKRSR